MYLNASVLPEMAVLTVNRAVSRGCPFKCADSQGTGSLSEVSLQASSDQPSGVPDAQGIPEKPEDLRSPVEQQETAAEAVECPADPTVPGSCVSQVNKENVPHICTNEGVAPQDTEVPDGMVSGERPEVAADSSPFSSEARGPEDPPVSTEDGKPAGGHEPPIEEPQSDGDQTFPGESKVGEAALRETPETMEPVTVPAQAVESTGISKCEDARLSTRPVSGWSIHRKTHCSQPVRCGISW